MNFQQAFTHLISSEGGYSNDPRDPGGETKFGISKRSYPLLDIKNLTLQEAQEIYKKDFWEPLGSMHPSLRFLVFDFAVNSGMQTAVRKLQQAIGAADDGHWGPISTAKLNATSLDVALANYTATRLEYLTSLSGWATYGKGWARRIAANIRIAVSAS